MDELLVKLGLDLSDYERELGNALRDADNFVKGLERIGSQIDGRTFSRGLVDGIKAGFTEAFASIEQQTQTATNALVANLERAGVASRRTSASVKDLFSTNVNLAPTTQQVGLLSGQLQRLLDPTRNARRELELFGDVMAQMGTKFVNLNASQRLIEGMSQAGREAATTFTLFGRTATTSAAGLSRIRAGLTTLAATSIGAAGGVGTLVNGLFLLGPGAPGVLAATGGILALVALDRLFMGSLRETREANEKLVVSLQRRIQVPLFQQLENDANAAEIAIIQTTIRLRELNQLALAQGGGGRGNAIFGPQIRQDEETLKRLKSLLEDITRQAAEARRQELISVTQAGVDQLAEIVTLGEARNDELSRARALIDDYNARLAAGVSSDEERLGLLRRRQALERALTLNQAKPFEEQRKASDELIQRLQLARDLQRDTVGIVDALVAQQDRLNASVQAQGGFERANLITLQSLQRVAAAISGLDFDAGTGTLVRDLRTAAEVSQLTGRGIDVLRTRLASAREEEERLRDVLGQIADRGATAPAGLVRQFQELQREIAATEAVLQQMATRPIATLTASVDAVLQRFQALNEAAEGLNAGQTLGVRNVGELEAAYEQVTRAIAANGGPLTANIELLQRQVQLAQALRDAVALPANLPGIEDAIVAPVSAAAKELRDAQNELRVLVAQGVDETTARTFLNISGLERALTAAKTQLANTLAGLGLRGETLARVLEAVDRSLGGLGANAAFGTESTSDLLRNLRLIGSAARGILQVADAFGDIDDSTRRALDGIISLAQAASDLKEAFDEANAAGKSIAAGDLVSGIAAGIGAAVSLFSGIFGGGESARERLLRENNEALKDAAAAFREGALRSAQAVADIGAAALNVEIQRIARQAEQLQRAFGAGQAGIDFLNRELAKLGLTFEDLQRFAQSRGLSLLDENGKLAADALAQLGLAADQFVAEVTQFGTSFSDQRRKLELANQLFGGTGVTEVDRLQIDQDLLARLLPSQADFIRALDLSTVDGREAFRKLLQDTFTAIEQGLILPEEFAGTVDDFINIAGDSADALDALGASARDAVAGLTNVPTGFKIALARFNSTLDQQQDRLIKDALTAGPTLEPRSLFDPTQRAIIGSDGSALPLPDSGGFTINGDVTVQVDGGDPVTIVDQIIDQLRTRSRGQFGVTSRGTGLR